MGNYEETNSSKNKSKGIWLSNEVLEIAGISWTERVILAMVHSYTENDMDCFFTNVYVVKINWTFLDSI